jgi:hypothetical protein
MTDSPADVNAAVSEENGTNARSDSEVDLTVLLVSGNRKTFRFQQDTTIAHVRNYVYSNWPEEWSSEQPANVESLRIVFLGKFLEDKTTLQGMLCKPSVMCREQDYPRGAADCPLYHQGTRCICQVRLESAPVTIAGRKVLLCLHHHVDLFSISINIPHLCRDRGQLAELGTVYVLFQAF